MAANVDAPSVNGNSMQRLQNEYDQLRRKYNEVQNAYQQAVSRLKKAETSQAELELRHNNELIHIASQLKEKIQSLELKQQRSGDDLEDFKQQLKFDLSRQYYEIVDELTADLEKQRRAYADLCLQNSILKAEFESVQKLAEDNEEKHVLKFANANAQWEAERAALQARIEQLSISSNQEASNQAVSTKCKLKELEAVSKSLEQQVADWRERYKKLEDEFQKKVRKDESELGALMEQLERSEEAKQQAEEDCKRALSEVSQAHQKREASDERYARTQRELAVLRQQMEHLQRKSSAETDEIKVELSQQITKLDKERSKLSLEVEELKKQNALSKEQSVKYETLYRNAENNTETMRRELRKGFDEEKQNWLDEKLSLEAKVRDFDHRLRDQDQKFMADKQKLQLDLRRALWEKEKLAEDMARAALSTENRKSTDDDVHLGVSDRNSKFSDDNIAKLSKTVAEQERRFAQLSNEFTAYRSSHEQFRQVLGLVDAQIEKTMNVDDGADVQHLIDDLKNKVGRLMSATASKSRLSDSGERRSVPATGKSKTKKR